MQNLILWLAELTLMGVYCYSKGTDWEDPDKAGDISILMSPIYSGKDLSTSIRSILSTLFERINLALPGETITTSPMAVAV